MVHQSVCESVCDGMVGVGWGDKVEDYSSCCSEWMAAKWPSVGLSFMLWQSTKTNIVLHWHQILHDTQLSLIHIFNIQHTLALND